MIEHVEPIRDPIRRLMPLAGDPAAVAQELRAADEYCVLTPKEDKDLPSGSIGNADPWTRYALAGIDRSGLAPLSPWGLTRRAPGGCGRCRRLTA